MAEFDVKNDETSTEANRNTKLSLQFLNTTCVPFFMTKKYAEFEEYTNNEINKSMGQLLVDTKKHILGEKEFDALDEIEIPLCIEHDEMNGLPERLQKDLNSQQWTRFQIIFAAKIGKILISLEHLFNTFGSQESSWLNISSWFGLTTKDALSKLVKRRTDYFKELVMKMKFRPTSCHETCENGNDDSKIASNGAQCTQLDEVD